MARRWVEEGEDDWDDESEDEYDSLYDDPESEGEPTIDCPYCGQELHEEAYHCPGCGNYLSQEDAPPRQKPIWIILGVVACLFVVYMWIASGCPVPIQ